MINSADLYFIRYYITEQKKASEIVMIVASAMVVPVYQAMQASTSEVIADLVAEIQSLRARVAALETA